MSDIDIEKLQADFENAITQQQNAEALYQEAKKEQDHNRKLLDSQIKSGIQAQFLKEESALNDVSKKADMNGRRITNLSHDVAKMGDEVKELRSELQKTATLDTLYAEREKELIRYYEQLKEQKEEEYRKFCDEIAGKEAKREKEAKKRAEEATESLNARIKEAEKKADKWVNEAKEKEDKATERLQSAKWKLKGFIIGWIILFIVALVLGIYLGYQVVYRGWLTFEGF